MIQTKIYTISNNESKVQNSTGMLAEGLNKDLMTPIKSIREKQRERPSP